MKNNIIELTQYNDIEGVRKAIAEGADINILYESTSWDADTLLTTLMFATQCGLNEIAELLIEKGAKLDLQTKYGLTALMIASSFGNTRIAKQLIEKGANQDLKDCMGKTALMKAIHSGHAEIIELLTTKN